MKFIIAKKIEMSQRFRDNGSVVPVTVLKADPCTVTAVKSDDKDGYLAIQLGTGTAKKVNRAMKGHLAKSGANTRTHREFRTKEAATKTVGEKMDVTQFEPGDFVNVVGTTKGKGFQGVVKRWHFRGGPASHGHKDNLRMPGSIGSGGIQRVFKGLKMGGRMGNERKTAINLEVVEVNAEKGELVVKGAVPGARGGLLLISGSKGKKSWSK